MPTSACGRSAVPLCRCEPQRRSPRAQYSKGKHTMEGEWHVEPQRCSPRAQYSKGKHVRGDWHEALIAWILRVARGLDVAQGLNEWREAFTNGSRP